MGEKKKGTVAKISFQEAIDLGEYEPEVLSKYSEWREMSPHAQLQKIREGMDNRRKQLLMQWAELDRGIDVRLKPKLEIAKKAMEAKLKKIENDRERLYLEFVTKD